MSNQQTRRHICLPLSILWLLFIWSNSLRTADASSQMSQGVLEWLMPLLARTRLPEVVWHTLIRKLAHMAEFAIAGLLWSAALSSESKSARIRWIRRGETLFICLASAAIDETIQRFIPGRSGELQDVCIDLLGSVIGILLSMGFTAFWKRGKLRRKV